MERQLRAGPSLSCGLSVMPTIALRKAWHYIGWCKAPLYAQEVHDPLADIPEIEQIADPAERARRLGEVLHGMPAAAAYVRALRQAAVRELRESGLSYGEISKKIGVHRNRAQQIGEGK